MENKAQIELKINLELIKNQLNVVKEDIKSLNDNINNQFKETSKNITNTLKEDLKKAFNSIKGDFKNSFSSLSKSIKDDLKKINFNDVSNSIIKSNLLLNSFYNSVNIIKQSLSEIIHFRIKIETDTNTIAGLMGSNYLLFDENGKEIKGVEKFNEQLKTSTQLIKELRFNSIKYGTDLSSNLDLFKQGMAAAAEGKVSVSQWADLSGRFASIGAAMGVSGQTLTRDVNDLMMNIRDTKFSRELGMEKGSKKRELYTEAIKEGKQYEFLLKELEAYQYAVQANSKTMGGSILVATSSLKEFGYNITNEFSKQIAKVGDLFRNLFNFDTKKAIPEIQNILDLFDIFGKILGEYILKTINEIIEKIKEFSSKLTTTDFNIISTTFKNILDIVDLIFKGLSSVFGIFSSMMTPLGIIEKNTNNIDNNIKNSNPSLLGFKKTVDAIKIVVASIVDLIKVIALIFKSVVGGISYAISQTIQSIFNIISFSINAIRSIKKSNPFNADKQPETTQEDNVFEQLSKSMEESKKVSLKIGIDVVDGSKGVLDDVFKAINEYGVINHTIKTKDEKEEQKTTTSTSANPRHENTLNIEKQNFKNANEENKKNIELRKKQAEEENLINEQKYKNEEITTKDYFNEKRRIINELYDYEIKQEEKLKDAVLAIHSFKNDKDRIENQGKLKDILKQIQIIEQERNNQILKADNQQKTKENLENKIKELNDVKNKITEEISKNNINKNNNELKLQLGEITNKNLLELDKKYLNDLYLLQIEEYNKELELNNLSEKDKREINNKKIQAQREYNEKINELNSKLVLDSKKDQLEIKNNFILSFNDMIFSVLKGTKSLKDGLKTLFQNIGDEYLKIAIKNQTDKLFNVNDKGEKGALNSALNTMSGLFTSKTDDKGNETTQAVFDIKQIFSDLSSKIIEIFQTITSLFATSNVSNTAGSIGDFTNLTSLFGSTETNSSSSTSVINNFNLNQSTDLRTQQQISNSLVDSLNFAFSRNA